MALMHCCFYSPSLGSNTSMNVIIPTIQGGEQINDTQVQAKYNYEKGLPVAILLHGAYGNADSWIRNSNVERYAQSRGLAVVMVSAENSFYQNMVHGHPYKSFIIDEVLPLVQNLYPVSKRPEDTFIGGFSMGGYGAWYLGMYVRAGQVQQSCQHERCTGSSCNGCDGRSAGRPCHLGKHLWCTAEYFRYRERPDVSV